MTIENRCEFFGGKPFFQVNNTVKQQKMKMHLSSFSSGVFNGLSVCRNYSYETPQLKLDKYISMSLFNCCFIAWKKGLTQNICIFFCIVILN